MKRFHFFAGLLLIISLNACEKYTIKVPEVSDDVSYSADVQPIFTKGCIGCHDGSGTADGGVGLNLTTGNSYTDLMAKSFIDTATPESSVLYIQLNKSSHSYYSSKAERAIVLSWIEQGALDN